MSAPAPDRSSRPSIAIIGSGIAGLTVADGLCSDYDIEIYEAASWIGGHTHTVDVEDAGRTLAIDTGFIVCNDWTYPNFLALLKKLDVPLQSSNMSFSVQDERSGLEYSGTNLNTLFAQRRNLTSPTFIRMLSDVLRFNSAAPRFLQQQNDQITLGDWLSAHRYSQRFIDLYISPMGQSIWSADKEAILGFPARFFIDFFSRHGFLSINNRPQWRVVVGGSREYVRALVKPFQKHVHTSTPIAAVTRSSNEVVLRTKDGSSRTFDAVVIACHADSALNLLTDPTATERELLGKFPYQQNEAVLHTDHTLLPCLPRARAAWNYHAREGNEKRCAITYDMNILQSLNTNTKYLVSLNIADRIAPESILARYEYAHPVYTLDGIAAQHRHSDISGHNNTFYCGAYWRHGFHEDGVVSGLNVLTQLRQWRVAHAQRTISRLD